MMNFSVLEKPVNNFNKIKNVRTKLLWGTPGNDVFLSVLIITYDRLPLLREAIQSVLSQEPVDYSWEIIVMDNNPASYQELQMIQDLNDTRICYYQNEKNIGHEGNINRGIELAKGKWVALLHDDDLLVPNYLQLIQKYIHLCKDFRRPLAYIRARNKMFWDLSEISAFQSVDKIEPRRCLRKENWTDALLYGSGPTYVNSCGSLVNRRAFLDIGGYNDELNPIGDATLGLILNKSGYTVISSEHVLGFYRQGKNLSSQKSTVLDCIYADTCLREYLYARNGRSMLFGTIFRNAQFATEINRKQKQLLQVGQTLSLEEVQSIRKYKKSFVTRTLLVVIRGIYYMIEKPCWFFYHILSPNHGRL